MPNELSEQSSILKRRIKGGNNNVNVNFSFHPGLFENLNGILLVLFYQKNNVSLKNYDILGSKM